VSFSCRNARPWLGRIPLLNTRTSRSSSSTMHPARRTLLSGTAPRPLVACTTRRSIILPFSRSQGPLRSMPQQQQFSLFPPQVLECQSPLHYVDTPEQPVTAKQLGTALLSQLFRAMPAAQHTRCHCCALQQHQAWIPLAARRVLPLLNK
jgi:hypothetical protein